MPLANRSIQPVYLGRKPLTEEEKEESVVQVAVCHSAVLGALIQLASLVRHADDLFCDLAEECQEIYEKTESIKSKIENVKRVVNSMDSTTVEIPVGTLTEFCKVTNHHTAKHGYDSDLFTAENRPYCIETRYSMCEVTPVHALKGVDLYRKDGMATSLLFKLLPIALKDTEVKMEDMNMPRASVPRHSWKKRYKQLKLKPRPKTIHGIDEILLENSHQQTSQGLTKSQSQPSVLVSVDTSGAGFERMSSFRQSLREDAQGRGRDRRKRRRRTVSGVPDNILQEIDLFENGRRILRNGPRKYSMDDLDDLDHTDLEARDQVMRQYLMEMDAQIAEREEMQYAVEKEGKLLRLIPCRRSRSVPKCVRMMASMGKKSSSSGGRVPLYEKRSSLRIPADETSVVREDNSNKSVGIMHNFTSSVSLSSQGSERLSRSSSKRSSMISNKIKSGLNRMSVAVRPRPKSLDFDSVGVVDEDKSRKEKPKTRSASMSRMATATLPEGTNSAAITRSASSESTVGPGSYYYFDSNTIPRAHQKKYDFPWDSLPKDWTTSVKLREISRRRRKEDRQSSSGNWSASGYSSNRQSMDSDVKSSMPSTTSQQSLGKDSGRDSPLVEKDGLDTGYMGDAASMESVSDTKSMSTNTDSDEWIRSLAERAASRGDVSSTDANALESLSRLTKENIRNLDILVPAKSKQRQPRNDFEEDGESSVYSLDQEGFYTSFHNDSGLRRSSNALLEEDEDLMMPRVRETKSLQSISTYKEMGGGFGQTSLSLGKLPNGSTSLTDCALDFPLADNDSFIDASDISTSDTLGPEESGVEYGDTGTLKAKKTKKKTPPPPPPPRTSSTLKDSDKNSFSKPNSDGNNSPTSTETSSESSDQEVIYARLKLKTSISAQTFPSCCATVTSDEEESTLNTSHERLNAEATEIQKMFPTDGDGWLNGTLPRVRKLQGGKPGMEGGKEFPTHSWPRFKKSTTTFQQGILKTPEKDKNKPCQPKTLNFAPVVNLFDAQTPGGVEMPLSRMSSSDESGSPPSSRPMETPPKFTHSTPDKRIAVADVGAKHASSSKLEADSQDWISKPYGPTSSISSPCASQQSQDSFFGVTPLPLDARNKHESTMGSTSTIALSDIDNSSLTHVSLDDSTPSGSTLSLNWDTDNTPNPTPLATPATTHKVIKDLPNDATSLYSAETDLRTSVNSSTPCPKLVDSEHVAIVELPPPPPPLSLSLMSPLSLSNGKTAALSPGLPPPPPPPLEEGPPIDPIDGKSLSLSNHPEKRSSSLTSHESRNSLNRHQIYGYSNSSESSSESRCYDNDQQARKSSAAYSSIPEPSDSKQTKAPQSKKSMPRTANSFQYNQSWSVPAARTEQKSTRGGQEADASKYQRSDRRRSSPVTSIESYSDSSNFSQRRRSGSSSVTSPTDSGFGSPSANSQPVASNSHSSFPQPSSSYSDKLSSFSINHQQQQQQQSQHQPIVLRAPKAPHIKQPMLPDSQSAYSSHNSHRQSQNKSRGDERIRPFSTGSSSSHSNESLNSQLSASSGSHLISKSKSNMESSRPLIQRGNSSESISSTGSAGRSDSYRVALASDFNDNVSLVPKGEKQKQNMKHPSANPAQSLSHKSRSFSLSTEPSSSSSSSAKSRPALTKSMSTPSPIISDDAIFRADSYRCAMQQAQANILGNWAARNSSYRLATNEEDVFVSDHRMDSCNLWTGKTGGTRDMRRMGITDVDQLKDYNDNGVKNKQVAQKGSETVHLRKKLGVKTDHSSNSIPAKEPAVELRRPSRSQKDKTKQKPLPSSYIRFDPIFESGEDLRASSESLRPPSITSIRTLIKSDSNDALHPEKPRLLGGKMNPRSPAQRRSSSGGRRGSEEKLGILGSIKTTIRSIGGSRGDN